MEKDLEKLKEKISDIVNLGQNLSESEENKETIQIIISAIEER